MLQNTALSITEAVTKLFNISISLGKLADEWKIPRITHIDPETWRPHKHIQRLPNSDKTQKAQLLTEHMAVTVQYLLTNGVM